MAHERWGNPVPRVVYVFNHAGAGGTERYVELLIRELAPRRMKAMLLYNRRGQLVDRLEALGIRCEQVTMRSRFDFVAACAIARLARQFGADTIHAMFLREHYLVRLARLFGCRARQLATVHLMLDKVANPPLKWLDEVVFRGMHRVIAVCGVLAGQLRRGYGLPESQVVAIPNGVRIPVDSGGDRAATRTRIRGELGIAGNAVVFLTAGRFSPEKGYDFLMAGILAWRKGRLSGTSSPPVCFVLAGEGPTHGEIREMILANGLDGLVLLTGYRGDLPDLLVAADVYVSPSRTEALSLSILEAMASALPILATAVGGTPELVQPVWDNGRLVPFGDAAALAEAIRWMETREPDRKGMGVRAREVVRDHFSLDGMIDRTACLYTELQGSRARGYNVHQSGLDP